MQDIDLLKKIKLEKIRLLKLKTKYMKDNKIFFFNTPNPLQAQILDAWDNDLYKTFGMTGANRIGKTTIGTILAFSVMFGFWPWSGKPIKFPHNYPRKIRYVGQDWEKHIQAVVVEAFKEWWPKRRKVIPKKNNQGIEYLWTDVETGSTLEIMSNGQKPELHEGWHGDLVIFDEPPTRDIRIANSRGLIDRLGREFYGMTLLGEAWISQEVVNARLKKTTELPDGTILPKGSPDPTVFFVDGDISVNVGFGITQEGVDAFEKKLSPDEVQSRIKGRPSYLANLVCRDFKRDIHLINRFKIPLNWIVNIGIDVHPRKEQAILFVAIAPDNRKYVIEEVLEHGDGTWIGEEIIRRIKRNSYRVNNIIIDPLSKSDSNNANEVYAQNTTYDKIDRVLNRHELYLTTASKAKDSGIIEINQHLNSANGEPTIFFFNDLIRTITEIEGWMYDKETQKPQKKDDDMMENLYRILLLGTEYYEEDEYDDEDESVDTTANSHTGY